MLNCIYYGLSKWLLDSKNTNVFYCQWICKISQSLVCLSQIFSFEKFQSFLENYTTTDSDYAGNGTETGLRFFMFLLNFLSVLIILVKVISILYIYTFGKHSIQKQFYNDSNAIRTHNHLFFKGTLNHLAKEPNDWAVLWVLVCMVHLTLWVNTDWVYTL